MGKIKKCAICQNDFNPGKHKHTLTCSKACCSELRKLSNDEKVRKFKETFVKKFGSREKECATCGNIFNTGKHKAKLNCSPECLKIYKEKHKDERMQKTREAIQEKYGVDHPSKIEGFAERVKQTKLERYGDENYSNKEQRKETNLERYGVEYVMQLSTVKDKGKETKKEKYGDENYNNREKAKETILEKFGTEHHLQTEECLEKMRNTNLERYNTDCTLFTDNAKEKRKEKNIELFGSEFFYSSEQFLSKIYDKKIKNISKILLDNNFSFNKDNYTQLRETGADGVMHYLKYDITCNKCNNTFKSALVNVVPICRICNPFTSTSGFQNEFRDFIQSMNIKFLENNRKIIKPLELDFYFEKEKISIELNGNYYHSERSGEKDKKYHLNKTTLCQIKNIKLIHLFEDEWINNKIIVKSRIKNLFNQTENKIYARKCEIKEITSEEKENFLFENHIQGNSVDSIRYGLYFNSELVSVMTFSKRRIVTGFEKSEEGEFELNRFCSLINTNVVGGFERLLSHFKKNNKFISIISYADCRWSGINPENTVYSKNGFKFLGQSPPSYFYMKTNDYYTRFHRFSLNKQTLLKEFNGDSSKTEWELAQENGFDRIWDCGTMKFELINGTI